VGKRTNLIKKKRNRQFRRTTPKSSNSVLKI
jgi:hypothetical protein